MGAAHSAIRVVARVLIQNEAGEVLLCRSRNGTAWVPPGGTVDPGETLFEAAAREALEEVGLAVHLGRMLYLQEFKPAGQDELVVEVAFHATVVGDHPNVAAVSGRHLEAAGTGERPWAGWFIQDEDGPRREVRWFARGQVTALMEPIYPAYLRDRFWAEGIGPDPYLGLVRGG